MAADSVGVLDHLNIEQAHIVGASMGGMIAQTVAIRYQERALSLVSIMSNTGSFWTGQPAPAMYALLLRPAPRDRDAFIQRGIDTFTRIGGSGYEIEVDELRDIATRSYDRGHDPRGSSRQLWAIVAERDRTPELKRLRLPATVIHGADDKLVRPSGGRATAKAIPGAKLLEVPGMGHGLPRGVWPIVLDAIEETANRAPGSARRRAPAGG
jgi:pimeloyl-ACP methyl ester carboxylesterase